MKYQEGQLISKDSRNQRAKFNEIHCKFIIAYFEKPENFTKTITDFYNYLKDHFHFSPNISLLELFSTLFILSNSLTKNYIQS